MIVYYYSPNLQITSIGVMPRAWEIFSMTPLSSRSATEKESGTKDNRRVLSQLLRNLEAGDVVIVPALDRLTRGGPFKMLSVLSEITSRGATYKSLAELWADTTHELGEVLVRDRALMI